MTEVFDPYLQWLGIRDPSRPPNHYRLLGVELFEGDPEVLANAADRQMSHVRTFQSGRRAAEAGRLLTEIAAAKICLLNPQKKAEYDAALWAQQQAKDQAGGLPYMAPPPNWPAAPGARAEAAPAPQEIPLARDSVRTLIAVAVFAALLVVIAGLFLFVVNLRGAREQGPDILASGGENQGVLGSTAKPGEQPVSGPEVKPSSDSHGDAEGKPPAQPRPDALTKTASDANAKPVAKSQPLAPLKPESQPDTDPLAGPADRRPALELMPTAALPAELSTTPAGAGRAASRLAVPGEAAQAAARREIREVFKEEYAQSLKPAEKATLAERLLAEGIETKDNPVARYVLLAEVRDLAAAAGNAALLRRAIEELAKSYDVDPAAEMSRTLAAAGDLVVPTAVKKELGIEALRLAREALGGEEFDLALTLAQAAHVLALKGRDAATGRQAKLLAEELPELKAQHEQAQQALQTLARNPKDPEANLVVGKYSCFLKNRWGEGLPLLVKGSDPMLQALAEAELAAAKGQAEPAQWITLADQWHEASKSVDARLARHFRARAVTWYKKALPALKGFTRARIERQIAQLDEG